MRRYVILQDVKKTQMMQGADVFESFKVIGHVVDLPFSPMMAQLSDAPATPTPALVQRMVDNLAFSPGDPVKLVALWFPDIKTEDGVLGYKDPAIKVISNGKRWALVEDLVTVSIDNPAALADFLIKI